MQSMDHKNNVSILLSFFFGFIYFFFFWFHFISIHFNSFQFISIEFNSIHFNSFQFNSIQFISFHFISFYFISYQFISFHFISFVSNFNFLFFNSEEPISFIPWDTNEPSNGGKGDCVTAGDQEGCVGFKFRNGNKNWHDSPCARATSANRAFICQCGVCVLPPPTPAPTPAPTPLPTPTPTSE